MLGHKQARAVLMAFLGLVGLSLAQQSAASYELPIDPAVGMPNFTTTNLNVIGYKSRGQVQILAYGGPFSGGQTTFNLPTSSYDVDYNWPPLFSGVRISATIKADGTASGYTSYRGDINGGNPIPGTTGIPYGNLFSATIVGVDTHITSDETSLCPYDVCKNMIAFDTTNFGGWASQFGEREPLLLTLYNPVTGAPMDFPDFDWFDSGYYGWNSLYGDMGHMFDEYGSLLGGNFFFAKATAIQVVPIPAALPLFVSALVGFAGLGRRFRGSAGRCNLSTALPA